MNGTAARHDDDYTLRPLQPWDAGATCDVSSAAFDDLERRLSMPHWSDETADESRRRGLARINHLLGTDAGGAWCATIDGNVIAAALAIRRETLWGLSTLVVDPAHQSSGLGRRLLTQTLEYAGGCNGAIILSSPDSRALRVYTTAGFELRPALFACGVVDRALIPAGLDVRDDGDADLELVDVVDNVVRGASHRPDIPALVSQGARFLAVTDRNDRGYAVAGAGHLRLLAATSPAVAQRLLWSAFAIAPPDKRSSVAFLDARQQWAFDIVLRARMELSNAGGVMVRGEVGPLTPSIPSGSYL